LVFITINLYNFILYILNNFFKKIYKKLLPRVLLTEWIRWHLTVAFTNAFTDRHIQSVFQTLTNSFTDGLNSSAFDSSCHSYRWIYRQIYSVGIWNTHRQIYRRYVSVSKSRYHRRNKNSLVYFKQETFFGAQIPSVKPSANDFFVFLTDIATEWGITNEEKADGLNPSVKTSVNKSPTNF